MVQISLQFMKNITLLITSIPNNKIDFVLLVFKTSTTSGKYMLNLVFARQMLASETSSSATVCPKAKQRTDMHFNVIYKKKTKIYTTLTFGVLFSNNDRNI